MMMAEENEMEEDVKHHRKPEEHEKQKVEETAGATNDKDVYTRLFTFIRHGEAEHNVAKKYASQDGRHRVHYDFSCVCHFMRQSSKQEKETDAYIYIYMCVCVCVCVFARGGWDVYRQGNPSAILDPALTPSGMEQAITLGESLKRDNVCFDVVITSPLRRAMQTTQLALGHLEAGGTKFIVTSLHTESGRSEKAQRGSSVSALRRDFPKSWDYSGLTANAWAISSNTGYMHPLPASRRLGKFRRLLFSMDKGLRVCVVGHSKTLKVLLGVGMKNCELLHAELASSVKRRTEQYE